MGSNDAIGAILEKALAEHGASIKAFSENVNLRLRGVEQKLDAKPRGDGGGGLYQPGELAEHLMKSEGLAAFLNGNTPRVDIAVPGHMFKAAIMNPYPLTNDNPLVAADRRPGIIAAPQRRLTIRDLFVQLPTDSNMVEFARELTFTNNAGPQYDGSSPSAGTEGAIKNESAMTFQLANAPVITLAHWVPASRQILSDAPALQQHIEGRLLYGLKLEEEDELLNGTGNTGELSGLIPNATAFAGGSSSLTPLDAVALGIAQLVTTDYEPTGIVLNPIDWWSSKFMLAKNSQGEYLLGNPAEMTQPRLWGLPVVVCGALPVGKFLTLDARRAAYIADKDEASVRIAEQHADFFVRNMVVLLVEERLTLVVQLSAAMIYGNLSY